MGAFSQTFFYSILIIFMPIMSYFCCKWYLFEGMLSYPSKDSAIYSSIVAVVVVHIFLIAFIVSAYSEDDKHKGHKGSGDPSIMKKLIAQDKVD